MMRIRPSTLKEAMRFVTKHHRHHDRPPGALWSIALELEGEPVAYVIVGVPVAPAFQSRALEVTRLCANAPPAANASSRLYGAAWRAANAMGCRRLITYTRRDEPGTSLRASGFWPTAIVKPDRHNHGNRGLRWLPGIYEPTTDIVERVRWEIGPDAVAETDELRDLGRRCRSEVAA